MTESVGELDELIGFVNDPKPEVRSLAVQHLASLTGSEDGAALLKANADKLFPALLRRLGDVFNISVHCLTTLINLSDDETIAEKLIDAGAVDRAVRGVLDSESETVELSAMFLSNLTRLPRACAALLQSDEPKDSVLHGYNFCKMLGAFCDPANVLASVTGEPGNSPPQDRHAWLATVLQNATQVPEGRALVMDPKRNILQALLPQITHPNLMRRRGVIAAIRNSLAIQDKHEWAVKELGLIGALMLPLALPASRYAAKDVERFPPALAKLMTEDKQMETDAKCRAMVVECFVTLASSSLSVLQAVRDHNVYGIILEYEDEEDSDDNRELVMRFVGLMLNKHEDEEAADAAAAAAAEAAEAIDDDDAGKGEAE